MKNEILKGINFDKHLFFVFKNGKTIKEDKMNEISGEVASKFKIRNYSERTVKNFEDIKCFINSLDAAAKNIMIITIDESGYTVLGDEDVKEVINNINSLIENNTKISEYFWKSE